MKLVLIHGINYQGSSETEIKENWSKLIRQTSGNSKVLDGVEVVAPYYGDRLHHFTSGIATSYAAVEQGSSLAVPASQARFATVLLEDIARELRIPEQEISASKGSFPAEQGLILDKVVHPLFRLIESHVPGVGNIVLRFVQQASAYFNVPGAREEIDGIVRPYLNHGDEQVVLGHSLGSVVTFSVLREISSLTPLYLTLGSPLALKTIRQKMGPPFLIPHGVRRWANGIDPSDFVGLGGDIDDTWFHENVHPIRGINNGFGAQAHSIEKYLGNKDVVGEISSTL